MAEEERPYDASDPKDVKARIKESQRWDDRRDRVILNILASEDGRRWIRETIELGHPGASSFSADPLRMAYAEGERNVGMQFMAQIMNASPELYMQMMAEANPKATEQKDETNG